MTDLPFLPYGRQTIDDSDIEAVVGVLRSDYLTTGPMIPAFEEALAERVGAKHAVVVSNGTAALHATAFAAKIGPGDEVLVPAITFVASANCVRYEGGEPVFVDVDPQTGLIDLAHAETLVTPKTKAIIPVHLNGAPVDLTACRAFADRHNLVLIEDAAHALGATFGGEPIGNGRYGDMAILSFHPVKHITTGEGGAILTEDDELAVRLRRFRDHGIERRAEHFTEPDAGPWHYEQIELGYNLRLSAIQCVLGINQLRRLGDFVGKRQALAARYDALLAEVPGVSPVRTAAMDSGHDTSAYHLYAVQIDFAEFGRTRSEVMAALRAASIGTQVHYIPVPAQPYYKARGHKMADFPGAQRYFDGALSLPLYPTLALTDVDRVVTALKNALAQPAAVDQRAS
ncbi:MAG: UDP-4-amino-4,6-dideoxy-N-acetyl-beta-L-altrosamine transaminase [Myxococcales bacterium]|nr:UDP-4-amino-4,6-dideoxy-N-acetyl-beta-L-altrosamine transaminase [Myxococcales bacterium]